MSDERFYLTTDNDGHWFIVPVSKQDEWTAWCELDQDDPSAWKYPEFAEGIGGSPTLVTFLKPEIQR